MQRSTLLGAVAMFAAVAVCETARADLLTGTTAPLSNLGRIGSSGGSAGTGPTVYDDFTLPSPGTVQSIRVWGVQDTAGFGMRSGVVVTIRENVPGAGGENATPGAAVYTRTLGIAATDTAVGWFGTADAGVQQYTINLPTGDGFDFQANTRYWIGVKALQGPGGFSWSRLGPDDSTSTATLTGAPAAQRFEDGFSGEEYFASTYRVWTPGDFISGLPDRWVFGSTGAEFAPNFQGTDMAFALYGTMEGIPEPTTLGTVGVAAAGLLGRRRRPTR